MRPSSTRPERRLIALACALAALLPAALPGTAAAKRHGHQSFSRAMLREVNRVRAIHHLPALHEDRRMDRGAAVHSHDMASHGYFGHGSWIGRVMAAAGSARSIGEVIGWRASSRPRTEAFKLVHAWLASPPHRANLLSSGFRRAGVGRATAGGNAFYTIDFASG